MKEGIRLRQLSDRVERSHEWSGTPKTHFKYTHVSKKKLSSHNTVDRPDCHLQAQLWRDCRTKVNWIAYDLQDFTEVKQGRITLTSVVRVGG